MYVDKSRTYIGIVEDNNDPKKLGRCRVRVLDIFDEIPKEDIPWASPWKDLNGNQFILPEVGKVLTVIFDSGNIYKPEYIYAEHFNINLENKLKTLDGNDYKSMRALMFDHKTQIYVNDSEGLKIDHKYNNLNIKEKTINANLKDNFSTLNLGDETANQKAILGNHWMDWFDEFVNNLLGQFGGPFLGNLGAPVVPNPAFITVLQKYKALRDPVFLSHHVNIVDNNQVNTVRLSSRQNTSEIGDSWKSTIKENPIQFELSNFKPSDGIVDVNRPDDPTYVAPPTDGTPEDYTGEGERPIPNSDPNSNPKVLKLIKFLQSKKYEIYTNKFELNIVSFRNKDNGTVTNKFDEKMCVFFKNENDSWVLIEYDMTTVPGFKPKTSSLPSKVALLKLGQYVNAYKIGNHQNKPEHPCLKFAKTKHHRNTDLSKYNFGSPVEEAAVGINIHRSGNPQGNSVFNWSEGCQVFKIYAGWQQFMDLCRRQVSQTKRDKFTYTLCLKSEFDSF